jgi:RNase P subunit RPR2
VRVLLGRLSDATYRHRTTCSDCGKPVYLGDRQQALVDRHLAIKDRRLLDFVVIRCQSCDVELGDLRVLR